MESDYLLNLERTLIKLPISTQICLIDRIVLITWLGFLFNWHPYRLHKTYIFFVISLLLLVSVLKQSCRKCHQIAKHHTCLRATTPNFEVFTASHLICFSNWWLIKSPHILFHDLLPQFKLYFNPQSSVLFWKPYAGKRVKVRKAYGKECLRCSFQEKSTLFLTFVLYYYDVNLDEVKYSASLQPSPHYINSVIR